MGASTDASDDSSPNACGLANSHSFAVLAAFIVGNEEVLMMRNPWGSSEYSSDWSKSDIRWTPDNLQAVPNGIDPRTSDAQGIIIVPITKFINGICFSEFNINHHK